MKALLIALVFAVVAITGTGCKKAAEMENTLLTGTWIKGTNPGDTLYFTKVDGKNMLRYNTSFNLSLPVFTETEYRYADSRLAIKDFMTAENHFHFIGSFQWKQEGKEFEVLGFEIFPFMSSTVTRFTYRKLN